MNTKHLKARILDLALQGKLVENSKIPNDVKSRIPSDFNPPFEIPNSWQWVKLGEIVSVTDFVANGSFATLRENVKYYNEKNYAILVRLADFTKNWDNNYIYCDKHAYDFLKKSSLKPNDIVMCNVGSLGVTFKVPDLGQPMTLAPNSILIRPLNKNILNDFLFYLFNSLFFKNSLNTIKSSTTQPKFNKTDFKTIYIPLPPLDEQEKIVKKIDELFSQIDILETSKQSLLKNIKHTKTRILDLALQGKLVKNSRIPNDVKSRIPSDFNPPFKIPNSWQWVKLGDICEISSGGTPSRNEAEFWENGTIPWLKIADIKDDYVNSSSEFITQKGLENSSAKIFKKGTLLFTIFATLGEVAILNIDASTNQAIVGLTPKKDNYITKFIFFALKNIKNSVNLIGRGATQKNINQTILKNFYIPLPPLDEQEKIVKKIDELFEILEIIENSL
ncbi:MAG: restriction endonuclease subunit S [Campylobacter sp.]|uniref:restriction endonuclease subunit S n=1 Tax=Campylobacter sp. TaxID=205 RepID=UPI002AA6C5C6|nr:restriction endonuclease subunit S [Campylobacter sp.]MCI7024282.1 restriction endonuclease subunit S [Campylobacter sp.]